MKIRYFLIGCLLLQPFCGFSQNFSLAECERMAVENNNRIEKARLETEAAVETRKEAFTHYFPSVEGMGSYFNVNRGLFRTTLHTGGLVTPELAAALSPDLLAALPSAVDISLLKNGLVGGVTATQPLFAGGRIVNSNKLAKVGEQASRIRLRLTEDEVLLQTHDYFWQIVMLRQKLETIAVVEQMLDHLHKDVAMAVNAGITTRNDLLRVELQMHEVQSNRLRIENGLKVTRMLLAQFVGADINGFDIKYDVSRDPNTPDALYQIPEVAVMHRYETMLLDESVNAARLRKKISSGERLPSIGVGGGYLYNDLGGKANNNGIIYASVTLPISEWWGGSHARKRHAIEELQAENERRNAIELMTVEINNTWNELVESYEQIALAEKSIDSSTENLRIVNNSYLAGTVPLSELLDAQVFFQQSRNQRSDAYSDYQVKALKYRQITAADR